MSTVGGILAGGRSSRMGSPKYALTLPGGERVIDRLADSMSAAGCARVVVLSSFDTGVALPHVADGRPGKGPLAAIESLMHAADDVSRYLICACDQPFVATGTLAQLLGLHTATGGVVVCQRDDDSTPEPFPMCISGTRSGAITKRLNADLLSMAGFLASCAEEGEVHTLKIDAHAAGRLVNINDPQEWQRAIAAFSGDDDGENAV